MIGPINVTGYTRHPDHLDYQPPRRARTMKIYLVKSNDGHVVRDHLVRAHTSAGAEKFVRAKFKPTVTAKVPTQDELLAAREEGVEIEDATAAPAASTEETQP